MFLTQKVFAGVMETVQTNVPLLGDFDLYTPYLHFFSVLFKLFNFQLFPDKILKNRFLCHKT